MQASSLLSHFSFAPEVLGERCTDALIGWTYKLPLTQDQGEAQACIDFFLLTLETADASHPLLKPEHLPQVALYASALDGATSCILTSSHSVLADAADSYHEATPRIRACLGRLQGLVSVDALQHMWAQCSAVKDVLRHSLPFARLIRTAEQETLNRLMALMQG